MDDSKEMQGTVGQYSVVVHRDKYAPDQERNWVYNLYKSSRLYQTSGAYAPSRTIVILWMMDELRESEEFREMADEIGESLQEVDE